MIVNLPGNRDMERSEIIKRFDELLEVPRNCTLDGLEEYLLDLADRTAEPNSLVEVMDKRLALVQNHIQLISLHLKQKYLSNKMISSASIADIFYTKQELANKYRVSVRTVTNWIVDGLEVEEVGGIKRISQRAVEKFKHSSKGKKFTWRSIAN